MEGIRVLPCIAAFRDGVRPDGPHDVCFAALGEVEGEKRPSQREYRRLTSSQSVDDMLDFSKLEDRPPKTRFLGKSAAAGKFLAVPTPDVPRNGGLGAAIASNLQLIDKIPPHSDILLANDVMPLLTFAHDLDIPFRPSIETRTVYSAFFWNDRGQSHNPSPNMR